VKIRHARRFLESGNKVKVTVRFRGRELAHRDIGAQHCLALAKQLEELGAVESPPRMDGRQMFMILAPTRKALARAAERAAAGEPEPEDLPEEEEDDEEDEELDELVD